MMQRAVADSTSSPSATPNPRGQTPNSAYQSYHLLQPSSQELTAFQASQPNSGSTRMMVSLRPLDPSYQADAPIRPATPMFAQQPITQQYQQANQQSVAQQFQQVAPPLSPMIQYQVTPPVTPTTTMFAHQTIAQEYQLDRARTPMLAQQPIFQQYHVTPPGTPINNMFAQQPMTQQLTQQPIYQVNPLATPTFAQEVNQPKLTQQFQFNSPVPMATQQPIQQYQQCDSPMLTQLPVTQQINSVAPQPQQMPMYSPIPFTPKPQQMIAPSHNHQQATQKPAEKREVSQWKLLNSGPVIDINGNIPKLLIVLQDDDEGKLWKTVVEFKLGRVAGREVFLKRISKVQIEN